MVTGQPNSILVYTNHKNDVWRTKEEELSTLQNVLDLEAKVKDWVTDYRNNGFSVSSKMISFESR